MIISIRDLASREGAVPIQNKLDLSPLLKGRKEIASASPLTVDLKAQSVLGSVEVEGKLTANLNMYCSRCLKPVSWELRIPFREVFTQQPVNEDDEEEINIHHVDEDKVDLTPYVEEQVNLEIPSVVLCDSDCLGLCSECGHNLNEGECGCRRESIDPRLAGLQDFFNK